MPAQIWDETTVTVVVPRPLYQHQPPAREETTMFLPRILTPAPPPPPRRSGSLWTAVAAAVAYTLLSYAEAVWHWLPYPPHPIAVAIAVKLMLWLVVAAWLRFQQQRQADRAEYNWLAAQLRSRVESIERELALTRKQAASRPARGVATVPGMGVDPQTLQAVRLLQNRLGG